MKVGILQFFGWRDRSVPLNSVYESALERFSIMDQTGYDAVWLAEHHFSSFSVCPSVHMMGTMAAARTKRLRIGMAVSLAPFYNPLRLAEEVALLDVLSGGRVNWGAGRGFERSEFAAFGIPGEESARPLPRDRRYRAEGLDQPAPHLPGQILPVRERRGAAQTVPDAASAGLDGGLLQARHRLGREPWSLHPDGPAFVPRRSDRKRRHYAAKLAEAGFSDAGRTIPMARLIAVDETAEKAHAVANASPNGRSRRTSATGTMCARGPPATSAAKTRCDFIWRT